ncbi:dolichyl-diphosphooligosaccharide--protein glycosyltransferase subunit 1B [Amborella trichopoda]|uniref:Dolichyl-diphosphooligosaccharide--protein glycosyltransferase subunit 1 n=1 Tax=Amborella trichopoda TaxID=13333 RepID=W1PKU2_AMBTC|nr:dolichyl-diphosphooligosaccharide--protein glycosyltransferase subunit 1B [Amborella trichopoda]ERN08374.1 hypothetical protein AMTR_s00148p00056840 [Amborella trichopoda]|eukprot:XP_006846793.1 dolichyl-diphosphooligosaccharide--protein glycosyltransferase subunit 1B [Amborella trichopoda]
MGASRLRFFALIFILLPFLFLFGISYASSELVINKAERRIDLTSSIVRVYTTLKVENTGPSSASEVLLAFSPAETEHLSVIKASFVEGKRKKKTFSPLPVNPTKLPSAPKGTQLFSLSLSKPLNNGESITLEVLTIFTHSLQPFPVEISQSESQFVHYRDSAVLLSPYEIKEQITYIKTPSNKIESYTRVDPTNVVGTELKYGRFNDRPAFSFLPIMVHFENNHPFAVVEELIRRIEVSHWGSVQVKEHYRLVHAGARHKGVFSRVDYQARPAFSGVSSLKHLLARLPPHVHSVYYRDEIGNISSSHLRGDSQKSELEIQPRYPLFGGWKAHFIIGYSLPLQDFLFETEEGKRYLNFSFGCPFVETVVDKLTIKIVLPEGSKVPTAEVPFLVEQDQETSFSYLDVIGRPVVVLKAKNIVPEHNVPFQVHYKFNRIFMLAEPLMLVSAVFLFFVACIAYLNIDLSIARPSSLQSSKE